MEFIVLQITALHAITNRNLEIPDKYKTRGNSKIEKYSWLMIDYFFVITMATLH